MFATTPRKIQGAHCVAYELTHGPIPGGMMVLHKCDNRSCCNPEHLRLGTHQDNMDDMVAKGRAPRGARHWSAKLTEGDIVTIRAEAGAGTRQAELARRYGVSDATISNIMRGKNWQHVAP